MASDDTAASPGQLAAEVRVELEALDRELAEIDMLVGQARSEAVRHEQKRAQAMDKLTNPGPNPNLVVLAEGYGTLVTLTKRAVLMEAQVDVLDGKRKALARHRTAIASLADRLDGVPIPGTGEVAPEDVALPPSLSRVVLSAQEDLRREIARAMHDGPAQSLTNIVLQAQIADRLLDRDVTMAREELRLLVLMVQQTLDATKNFIFDVRPMVLDDLGLVPTLRRSTRERGRRSHVPVEFESLGTDRRLPMDVESTVFRILDEALAAYLHLAPERVLLRLDWGDELECLLSAHRTPAAIGDEPLPDVPTDEMPDALRQMIQDRHDARDAAEEAAEQEAIVVLPPQARRDVLERAGSIGAKVEIGGGG
ncbi:MAG TPA: histidine kinase, partial [Candidatus Limnocylindrales bacterium]|nr:histidine kinase [Candidatus Limnocylindrales bacterium]